MATGYLGSPQLARQGSFIMNNEEMRKFGKNGTDMAVMSLAVWTKGAQAIAAEVVDYSRKSAESSAAAWEKLLNAKSIEKAAEVQTEFLKLSYENFVAEATKLSELYVDLAKEAYRPFEGAVAKASSMR
jgi:phasin family protein